MPRASNPETATALFNNPRGLIVAALDWSAIDHYHAAVDALQLSTSEDWRGRLLSSLHGIAIEYRLFHQSHPQGPEIREAVEGIATACRQVDRHLETLLAARISAPPNTPDRTSVLTALYPCMVELLLSEVRGFPWDEREPGEAPRRSEYSRIAVRIERLAAQLDLPGLEKTTRPVDPAFDRAVARLARLYEEATELDAYSEHKGDDPDYRSPFAQMVVAFWPAIAAAPPSNQRISAALQRRDELGPEFWTNKRTAIPEPICSAPNIPEEDSEQ